MKELSWSRGWPEGSSYRVQVVDVVVVLMVLGLAVVVVVVVPGAQLEDVRQGGEEEEQHFEHQLLGGPVPDKEGQQPENLDLDQLDDEHDGEESEKQLVFEDFLCKNSKFGD